MEYCNSLRIRRELTSPYAAAERPSKSGLSRAIKAGHAARIEVNRLFPDVHLERLKGVRDPDGLSLWMESVLWASEGSNRSATTANSGMLSPHEVILGSRPPMPVLPFSKPAYHRVPRQSKLDRQARPCYFLIFGYNHGERLFQGYGRGNGEDRALARRHMAPAAGTVNFPGPDSWIGRALVTVWCRNAGLRAHPPGSCRY